MKRARYNKVLTRDHYLSNK